MRLVCFVIVLLAAYIGLQFLPLLAPAGVRHAFPDVIRLGSAALLCAAMLGLYVGLARLLERRQPAELSPRAGALPGLAWALFGAALFVCTVLLLAAAHVVAWRGYAGSSGLSRAVAIALTSAVGEELVFRGALFRILEQWFGSTAAITVSGVLFGLLHAANPGATLTSTAAIALEAGVLLAATYALTGNLWAPIGLHFGWNLTEGGVFGMAVSGGQSHGLLNVSLSGPPLLTGGSFGPEASIVAVAVSLAASTILIALTIRASRWLSVRFRTVLA